MIINIIMMNMSMIMIWQNDFSDPEFSPEQLDIDQKLRKLGLVKILFGSRVHDHHCYHGDAR